MTVVNVLEDICRKVIDHFLCEPETFEGAVRHLVVCEIVIHCRLKFVILNKIEGKITLYFSIKNKKVCYQHSVLERISIEV